MEMKNLVYEIGWPNNFEVGDLIDIDKIGQSKRDWLKHLEEATQKHEMGEFSPDTYSRPVQNTPAYIYHIKDGLVLSVRKTTFEAVPADSKRVILEFE